eukprot:CAMPEP_0171465038 /NCGR_PEP_ID=MMETSP0945-20130129/8193_1 /TAXON_ID=109269 /ORGANISM="Vaucheria litorea, Strain CCMP2940" /LENGTH=301 /DNA_ID=CAMNT_0011992399 /DNA_START=39 /DNA_END=944 /DNA_ORIENTATION=+
MSLVKELRESSGAPILDCMKALSDEEVKGNIKAAYAWLRKKGISKASSLNNRSANEGLIGIKNDGKKGIIVEVNCETDFVARTESFHDLVANAISTAKYIDEVHMQIPKVQNVLDSEVPNTKHCFREMLADSIGAIRENISLKRIDTISASHDGVLASYVHGSYLPGRNMGRSGALISLKYIGKRNDAKDMLQDIAKKLAMHCVAAKPRYLCKNAIPDSDILQEKEILKEQLKNSGKSQIIQDKIIEGRTNNFFSETTLKGQNHMIVDGNPKVETYLQKMGHELNGTIEILDFVRYEVGGK